MKNDIFSFIFLLALIVLVLVVRYDFYKFKKETVLAFNILSDLVVRDDGKMKPLLIPKYMQQSNFIVSKDKSAYIPMVYKDSEDFKNNSESSIQKKDDLFWTGKTNDNFYYNMGLLYTECAGSEK